MKTILFMLGVPLCLVAAGSVTDRASSIAGKKTPRLVFERSADDGGLPLPKDEQGRAVVAEGSPFRLTVELELELELLDHGTAGRRISVTASRDLGDPALGGVKAGDDLSFLAHRTRERGTLRLAIEFEPGSDLLPEPGPMSFTATVEGGWHGLLAQAKTAHIDVRTITSLRVHVLPIFTTYCWGCHGATTKFEGLELTLTGVFSTAVNVRAHETPTGSCAELRLAPFDPDASYLVHKVQGTHLGGCVMGGGDRMPAGGPFLNNTQIDVIRSWIAQGCRND